MILLLLVAGLLVPPPPDEDPLDRVETILDEEDSLAAQLERLDRQIIEVNREQAAEAAQLEAAQTKLGEIDHRLEIVHVRARTQRARLTRRLRARQHLESTAWLQVLLSSTEPAELVRRQHYLDRILGADVALLSNMKADRALLELLRRERAAALRTVRQSSETLEQRRRTLEADRAVRTALMQRLRGERRLMVRLARGQAAQQAQVGALLGTDPSAGAGLEGHFGEEYSRLPAPAPGRIIGHFGEQVDHRLGGTRTFSKGLRIEAPAGAPVRAVYSARVRYAGWYQGFGNLVILDHGDGYHTLYAHLERVDCVEGAVLAQGEVLGVVGETGSLVGPQLYFEVRVDGEPEDPRRWLRK